VHNKRGREKFKAWLAPPSIWVDTDGGVHADLNAILDELGLPHTEENLARAARGAQAFMLRFNPTELPIVRRRHPPTL
jgi:hypothetical protein